MVENALQNNPDARHALRAAPAAHGVNFLLRRVEHAGSAACAVINDMATFDQAGIDDGYLDEIREGDKFTVEASK
jgi:hypothetical protein